MTIIRKAGVLFLFLLLGKVSLAQSFAGKNVNRIAFPIGGMGAGMFCLDGTGSISHVSIRNNPEMFNEPVMFAALGVKGHPEYARVLEGPVPDWKKFGAPRTGDGSPGTDWGLARFTSNTFSSRFPFASIKLFDKQLPISVSITGWSPFIPTDENSSSLPLGGLEYSFTNTSNRVQQCTFSFNSANFVGNKINETTNGFILSDEGTAKAGFAVFTNEPHTVVDNAWFRGGFYDALSMAWEKVVGAKAIPNKPVDGAAGASLYVPFTLKPHQTKTIHVMLCWYVPETKMRLGWSSEASIPSDFSVEDRSLRLPSPFHKPWYSSQFKNLGDLIAFWQSNYDTLKKKTEIFANAFYKSTLPAVVTEAVAANLSILKSTTILRQYDGRFWGWEGSHDNIGSCPGSCTHVYNYAQSLCHLFPAMERSIRETEFNENQNKEGHQTFRAMLPIRPMGHSTPAAADGQLGGIMKIYRDWHICGDSAWLRKLFPKVKLSLDYCIELWDPRRTGLIEEPHHNTYDIEFWGANGMTTSFYLGALEAYIEMANFLHEDKSVYSGLLAKGKVAMETKLWNGNYFMQQIEWKGLRTNDPLEEAKKSFAGGYSPESVALFEKEGPRYQYGNGCLSDGVIGAWMATVCGLPNPIDQKKTINHLLSVYKYNLKLDLSSFSNPQRPGYALGKEGGLLLCTWPKGGERSLPFVYSNEVWTGIEYEVASHLIFMGHVKEGLDIVRTARKRYDGSTRNPFDEYECGHWYARAMSSYALIEALTGVRYDAVSKTLYINSKIGDFISFLSTNTGFGNVSYKNGKATIRAVYGRIDVRHIQVDHK